MGRRGGGGGGGVAGAVVWILFLRGAKLAERHHHLARRVPRNASQIAGDGTSQAL